ncbi:MAG: peptidoglycan-binding protein LysM [Gammaproteobacteria bacterium]
MGLLDFAKNIGKKLFDREDDAAEKIKEHIQAENPGVDGLSVTVEDGVAKLSGKAKDAEALEKAVLMAGNVEGIEKVVVDDLEAPPQTAKVEYYEIRKGDTLSKLAKQYYGDPMKYPRIFEANREVVKDADLIYPGQKIRIPLD